MTTTLVQYAYEIKPLEFGQGGLFESLYDPNLEAFMKIPAHAVVCSPHWPQSPPLSIVPHVSHHIADHEPEPTERPPRYPVRGSLQHQDPGKVVMQYQRVPSPPGARHHRRGAYIPVEAPSGASVSFPYPRAPSRPQAPPVQGTSIAASRGRRSTRKRSSRSPDAAYDYSDQHFFADFSDSDNDDMLPTPPAKKRRRQGRGGRKSRSSSVSRAPRRSVRLKVEPGTEDETEDVDMNAISSSGDGMSPVSSKLNKSKHRKHYRYTHKRVCKPKEIAKHRWQFIEDHARVLEIMNRIFSGFESDYGANWCRYCGAKTASSYSKSPWGPSKLCTKHYVDGMQKDTLNLSNYDEPTEPEKPINSAANCEIFYMNRMIRTYGVGAGVLSLAGEVIET